MLGLTFKGNCPDTRNTKVIDILNELQTYEITTSVYDPIADRDEAKREYGIDLISEEEMKNFDAVIVAVDHDDFKDLSADDIAAMYSAENGSKVFFDVKGIYDKEEFENAGFDYWRL